MKKIIPFFLLITICISHLNIMDAIIHFSSIYNTDKTKMVKEFPDDEEEKETEKDLKEKTNETEKYINRNSYFLSNLNQLSKNRFMLFNTYLNLHPYHDDDMRPPKTA